MTTSQPRRAPRAAMTTLDDTPLAEPLYSPVCTFCKWWGAHPDRWQYCSAWPHAGGGAKIPQRVWAAQTNGPDAHPTAADGYYHTRPVGGEATDKQGRPYLFEPVPGAKLPAKLRAAYTQAKQAAEKPPQ